MAKTNPLRTDRIGPNALVVMNGETYRATRPTALGWELTTVGSPRRIELLTHARLDRGEGDGSIVVKRPAGDPFAIANMTREQRRDMFLKDLWMRLATAGLKDGTLASTGDKALEGLFERKMDFVRDALAAWERDANFDHAADRNGKRRKANVGRAGQVFELAPSTRHFRRLHKRYVARNSHPLSMRKQTEASNKGGRRVTDYVRNRVTETAEKYASEINPTIAGLHRRVKAEIVLYNVGKAEELQEFAPCERTLARMIRDMPEGQKIGGRKDARALFRAMGPTGDGPEYRRVGERSEHDCWNIPLFLLLKKANVLGEVPVHIRDELQEQVGRIHVAAVADKASGYITGMRFGMSESGELVTAALRMSLTDKSKYAAWAGCEAPWDLYSGIEEGTTDGGPAYTSDRFLSAAIPAFGSHVYAAGGLPHLRGLIESIFSTLHKGFIAMLVARAFENVVAKGDYEPEKRAALTLDGFLRLMIRYVVDVYHNMPRNGGLRRSPRREFEAKASGMDTKPPPSPEEIRVWFGTEIPERQLGPGGVVFMHIRYDSNWLVKYRIHMGLEEVVIRVDKDDLGAISVLLDGDWITVPALDPEFRGVSLADWMALLADMRLRFGEEAAIDFRQFVAPALLHIESVSREAERAMGLFEVFWTRETLELEEERLVLRTVYDDNPADHAEVPSFGAGTVGLRFERKVPETSLPPTEPPAPAPADATESNAETASPRRRMTFLEE